jgi:hypothetical protein
MRNERFNAHLCFRAASALEATTKALLDSARELEGSTDDAGREAAAALKAAQQQLLEARKALQAAGASRSPLQLVAPRR